VSALARRLGNVYPGWWLAVHTSISLGLVAGVTFWGFGLFVAPWEDEFGWSRATTSGAISLTLLMSGLASPIVGRLVDRFQPRPVLAVGSAATVVTYLLLSQMHTLWQFFVLLAVLAFFRAWVFYIPLTTLITRWFVKRRATAMGIATSGFGLGGLAFLPIVSLCVSSLGWRETFVVAAALVVAINGTFLLFFGNGPSDRWRSVYLSPESSRAASSDAGLFALDTLKSVLTSRVFWLMSMGFALFFCAQWAFLFHAIPYFENRGVSSEHAAFVLSGAAGLGVALRLSAGVLIDRVRRYEVLAVAVVLTMAAALALIAMGVTVVYLLAFVLFWGIGSGFGPLLEPMLVTRMFGREKYASVYGAIDGVDTIVAISGPWIGGLLFDASHSYIPVLVLYAGLFVAGAVAFLGVAAVVQGAKVRSAEPAALARAA
jgi:MFS family permease